MWVNLCQSVTRMILNVLLLMQFHTYKRSVTCNRLCKYTNSVIHMYIDRHEHTPAHYALMAPRLFVGFTISLCQKMNNSLLPLLLHLPRSPSSRIPPFTCGHVNHIQKRISSDETESNLLRDLMWLHGAEVIVLCRGWGIFQFYPVKSELNKPLFI